MKHFKDDDGDTLCGAEWDADGVARNAGECCRDCINVCFRRAVQSIKLPGIDIKFGGQI